LSIFGDQFVQNPFSVYDQLREAGPVHQVTTPDGAPVWLVTRYADVRAALGDQRLSLSKTNAHGGGYKGLSLPPALDANLLNLDPPDHTRLRRLVSAAFTPGRVESLRDKVQAGADQLIDGIQPLGQADLITSFAAPLPLQVIGDLLGVPVGDRARFQSWTNSLFAPVQSSDVKDAVVNIIGFIVALIAGKRAEPADDLLSAMITARDAEDRLSEDELLSLAFLILWAGYENSVHLIGNGLLALLCDPESLARMRSAPASGVEELLRYAEPNQFAIRRFPVVAVEIGGVTIPAGQTVLLGITSANRDPARFDSPELLDLGRTDNQHLSLGLGVHYCLGAPLARLEAEVAIGTLLRRLPGLALAVDRSQLKWRPSFRSRGLLELPVTF
jgi:cytochrome P450